MLDEPIHSIVTREVQGSNSNECYTGQIKGVFFTFSMPRLADDLSSAFVFKQILSE